MLACCPADLNLGESSPPCLHFSALLLPWERQVIAITAVCRGSGTRPHGSSETRHTNLDFGLRLVTFQNRHPNPKKSHGLLPGTGAPVWKVPPAQLPWRPDSSHSPSLSEDVQGTWAPSPPPCHACSYLQGLSGPPTCLPLARSLCRVSMQRLPEGPPSLPEGLGLPSQGYGTAKGVGRRWPVA